MIVKSKFKTFGFWLSIISLFGGLIFLFYFLFEGIGDIPIYGTLFGLLVLLIVIIIYGKLLWDSKIIVIETDKKMISFKNQFTRKLKTYSFDSLDGYVVVMEPISSGYAKNLYLVKNGIFIVRITNFIYSNQDELQSSLSSLKDLGIVTYSYLNSIKILLRKKIIVDNGSR